MIYTSSIFNYDNMLYLIKVYATFNYGICHILLWCMP